MVLSAGWKIRLFCFYGDDDNNDEVNDKCQLQWQWHINLPKRLSRQAPAVVDWDVYLMLVHWWHEKYGSRSPSSDWSDFLQQGQRWWQCQQQLHNN